MLDDEMFEIDLLKLTKVIWKKAWAIIMVAAIFGGVMFAYGNYTYVPQYTAKTTLYASYQNERDFSFGENSGNISQNSLADNRNLALTCIAVLKTRMFQEKVIERADLDITYPYLANTITAEVIDKTEIFTVRATCDNAEEAALIANTVAEILPELIAIIDTNYKVGIIDSALVPSASNGNNVVENTVFAAVVGALSACAVVTVGEIKTEWQEHKRKKI